ncbi:MAG: transposase [Nostoc sp. C3-bin3]|nr:transposase [Nostoc sp. C3-bin3]
MPYSSSLSDKEWEIIEPLLPQKKQTRPPKWTKRQILDGIFYQAKPKKQPLGKLDLCL